TRFGTSHGYVRDMAEAIGAALRKAELPPARVARLVLGAPEPRAAAEAARRAGLDPARQLEASLLAEAGLLGTPEPLALLARAPACRTTSSGSAAASSPSPSTTWRRCRSIPCRWPSSTWTAAAASTSR